MLQKLLKDLDENRSPVDNKACGLAKPDNFISSCRVLEIKNDFTVCHTMTRTKAGRKEEKRRPGTMKKFSLMP